MDSIENTLKYLNSLEDNKDITVKRGRLINKINNKIKKLKNQEQTEEVKNTIAELERILEEQISLLRENNKINIEEQENMLDKVTDAEDVSRITLERGRLIRKIRREIKKLEKGNLNDKEKQFLEELKVRFEAEVNNHKDQINERYKDEFLDVKATVPTLVTVLPKAVGLQVDKVATCIEELSLAKTNKEKIFGSISLLKSVGMLVATPVIYAGKFIINHWYLILLLLSLLKLPKLGGGGKKNNNNDFNGEPQEQEEFAYDTELEYEPSVSTETEVEPNIETVPGTEPVPGVEPGLEPAPVPGLPKPSPVPGLVPKPNHVPGIVPKPGENVPQTDTGTGGIPNVSYVEPDSAIDVEPEVPVSSIPELTPESTELISDMNKAFFQGLEEDYSFFIKEIHPDTIVVETEEEFIEAVKETTGNVLKPGTAERLYNASGVIHPAERNIIWLEAERNSGMNFHYFENYSDAMNYVLSGTEEGLTNYYNEFANDYSQEAMSLSGTFSFDNPLVQQISSSLGISAGAAFTLFLIYEGIQYGLAIPTHGGSLLLPG